MITLSFEGGNTVGGDCDAEAEIRSYLTEKKYSLHISGGTIYHLLCRKPATIALMLVCAAMTYIHGRSHWIHQAGDSVCVREVWEWVYVSSRDAGISGRAVINTEGSLPGARGGRRRIVACQAVMM